MCVKSKKKAFLVERDLYWGTNSQRRFFQTRNTEIVRLRIAIVLLTQNFAEPLKTKKLKLQPTIEKVKQLAIKT